MVADVFPINVEYAIRVILTINLSKRKFCARFAPHSLSDEQKLARVHRCKNVSKKIEISKIMGVKTQCFQYDCHTKRQILGQKSVASPKRKKIAFSKIRNQNNAHYFYKRAKALFITNL